AGVVGGPAGEEVRAGEASDGDDHAAAGDQGVEGGLDAVEHAGQVGVEDALPGVGIEVLDRPAPADAGVGDQQVEAPERLDGAPHRLALGLQVPHVAGDG